MHRAFHMAGWGYVVICAAFVYRSGAARSRAGDGAATTTTGTNVPAVPNDLTPGSLGEAEQWFRRIRPYCNSVEVAVVERQTPAPSSVYGAGYDAACFALAGRIDEARRRIDALPAADRYRAAGIVFDVGHPVADAGDDLAAGPIMELVVDYWPNHYMALYHAGMAEYMLGQFDLAHHSLNNFLKAYSPNDGWRSNAIDVLKRIESGSRPNRATLQRPSEPGS